MLQHQQMGFCRNMHFYIPQEMGEGRLELQLRKHYQGQNTTGIHIYTAQHFPAPVDSELGTFQSQLIKV